MKKKLYYLTVVLIAVLLLVAGCGTGVENQQESASVTPSPTATPTATPSPTPDASALAAASEKAAMEELDKQIQAFLNYQGEYAPESITYINWAKEITKLGLLDTSPKVEGILLGHVNIGDPLLLIVGFDGVDENRFVTPIELPTYYLDDPDPILSFSFRQYSSPIVDYDTKYFDTKSKEEISNTLSELESNVISISLVTNDDDRELERELEIFKDQPLAIRFLEDLKVKTSYAKALAMEVADNGFDEIYFKIPEDIKLEKIESADDVSKIDLSKVVDIHSIGFFNRDFKGITK